MIRYTQGNLLQAPSEALVNTVNEVGVMGKGIAQMFREAFPDNNRAYEEACRRQEVRVGHVFVTRNTTLIGPRWIINFPTKQHWRHPSKLEWIREGLADLAKVIQSEGIQSIALPPLGCGNGGLQWDHVRREIVAALGAVADVDVLVYEPTTTYQNSPKRSGVVELTSARALIVELVRRYSVLGLDCTNLEIQKLAWFLDEAIRGLDLPDPLQLRFSANMYGPYSDQLRHLLDGLDGSYLHCEKRLSDAGPMDLIWFEDAKRIDLAEYLASSAMGYLPALERADAIIDGFQSPLGMEALATVDWLLRRENSAATLDAIREGLATWPGGAGASARKLRLFDDQLINLALKKLAPASA